MRTTMIQFPNPILEDGKDDYIGECSFKTLFEESDVRIDSEYISIPIEYQLKCEALSKRIKSGEAVACVSVVSSAASYSELFTFLPDDCSMEIKIPKYSVVKKIEIRGYIIAKTDIEKFSSPTEFNQEYFRGLDFFIRKGDVLAIDNIRQLYVDNSELEKPISSIFTIVDDENAELDIDVTFDDEKICVRLKKEINKSYQKLAKNAARYSQGVMLYPVLVEAVSKVVLNLQDIYIDGDYRERRWFRSIVNQCDKRNIDLSNPEYSVTGIANSIFGNVAWDSIKGFQDFVETEFGGNETHMIGGMD